MDSKHTAAAHAETPTCNAGSDQPFTCHSLKCRTRARELAVPVLPPPILTLVRSECANPLHEGCGGCDYPPPCTTCEVCSGSICNCATLEHVGQDGTRPAACGSPALCADCDLCEYCGRVNAAPVLRTVQKLSGPVTFRYCSAACADEEGEHTSEAPAFTWDRATEVMEKGGAR